MEIEDRDTNDLLGIIVGQLQTEDIIDDIIQYQTNSLSGSYKLDPFVGGDFQIKQEPLHLTDQEKKERTKKDNHNQSEYTWSSHIWWVHLKSTPHW